MPRLKPQEKRQLLIKQRAELDARLRAIEAQEREAERKRDTRRKVIAGAIALEQLERNPNDTFAVQFREFLDRFVEPRSRDLFPFLATDKVQAVAGSVESDIVEDAAKAA